LRVKRIEAWFPTHIYAAVLQPRWQALNRELLAECRQLRDFDEAGRKWSAKSYPGGYTSYGSLDKVHRMSSTFMELQARIDRHVKAYAKILDFDLSERTLEMTDCWINIMPRQVAHSLHLHPNSVISGTYYVATPRGCAGCAAACSEGAPGEPDFRDLPGACGACDAVRELAAPRGGRQSGGS
jgi:uncharacterized protein (TIGR02466 family)